MKRGGITEQFQIDLAGAAFEIAILLGGIVIGGYVDRTKKYKQVTMACIASTAALLIPLGLTEHRIGNEPILVILALLGLGMAAGPVQPINAELAVDVTYPGDETAVESVQQIGGNLISALLVPIAEKASELDYQILPKNPELASDIRGDVVLLTMIAGLTLAYFASLSSGWNKIRFLSWMLSMCLWRRRRRRRRRRRAMNPIWLQWIPPMTPPTTTVLMIMNNQWRRRNHSIFSYKSSFDKVRILALLYLFSGRGEKCEKE